MKLELYTDQLARLPQEGRHIIGQIEADTIVVYQAYKPSIAAAAVANQRLGGGGFSFGRMSWIKPGFLWMMYRSGWATKPDQERILALKISTAHFNEILKRAVHTVFERAIYPNEADWKAALSQSDVRLQWDPDHDPAGKPVLRRAMQLGMNGDTLKQFGTEWLLEIEDVTPFVEQQRERVFTGKLHDLRVPHEDVLPVPNPQLVHKLAMHKRL